MPWFDSLPWRRRTASLSAQRVGAGVAVLHGDQVLLVQRRDNGLWDVPGGRVEPGEDTLTAALRELHEETGLLVRHAALLDVFSGPKCRHTYPDGNVVDWVTVLYRADLSDGHAPPELRPGDDASAARWWPLSALPAERSAATGAYLRAVKESWPACGSQL